METGNAIIKRATLTTEDYGILSAWLTLDYGGSGQSFGGYSLYSPGSPDQASIGGYFIYRIMQVVGVTEWSELAGTAIRVRASHERVEAIGNIIKDDWFEPAKELQRANNERFPDAR